MACDGIVHLRRAGPDDADGIAEVHVLTWRAAYRGLLPPHVLDGLSITRRAETWRPQLDAVHGDRRPWVADCDTNVVGFVSVGPSRDGDTDERTGELYAIYVHPDCWSRGIGRSLMAHARRDLRVRGYGAATLWVLEGNRQARDFYQAGGWRLDGTTRTESIRETSVQEVRYRMDPV